MSRRRFTAEQLGRLSMAKVIRLRSGETHRPTGVWVVVVEGRVFVRSWNDKVSGWLRAFQGDPLGILLLDSQEIAIRGVRPRSDRLLAAVTTAYGRKYTSTANRKWVRGFAAPRRVVATLELQPA